MSDVKTEHPVQMVSIEAVVIGPDGKVKEDLGTVAYWNRNPLIQFMYNMRQRLRGRRNGRITGNL